MSNEDLVSAARRSFIIAIGPKKGFNGPAPRVMVVQAISARNAKLSAINQCRKGPFSHRSYSMWEIISCEEAKSE